MTQDQLNEALRGQVIRDVQLLDNGCARLVFAGASLEIGGSIDYGRDRDQVVVGLRVLEGGQ